MCISDSFHNHKAVVKGQKTSTRCAQRFKMDDNPDLFKSTGNMLYIVHTAHPYLMKTY